MSNFERKFARRSRLAGFGRPREILVRPERSYEHFASFAGGYNTADSREDTPADSSPQMLDMEITSDDALRRAPGMTGVSTLTGRTPLPQLVLHASLENRSELVLFDPPWIGVRSYGPTVWYDVGLAGDRLFKWTNFGGTLIFSNGIAKVYARQAGAATIEEVPEAPVARAYGTFASRVWAGGAIIDGRYEPQGLAWSAANTDYRDWSGIGSGNELLISNVEEGDRIMRLIAMGLDFMAILCRKSVWVARRTGLRDRPGDPQPRVPGVGLVTNQAADVTRYGVLFLSDDGPQLFDGNAVHPIGEEIIPHLLPLDYANLQLYNSTYNPASKRWWLFTPTATWIFDVVKKRWTRRSVVAQASACFAEQFDPTTWGELTGDWGSQVLTWTEFSPEQGELLTQHFLGVDAGTYKLAVEDQAALSAFGTTLDPYWETPVRQSQPSTQLLLLDDVLVTYKGAGTLQVSLPDNAGEFVAQPNVVLPAVAGKPDAARLQPVWTGRGVGARVRIVEGDPRLYRVSVGYMLRGTRV